MKITKWIDLGSQEVEIEIGAEDVFAALATFDDDGERDMEYRIKKAVNHLAVVFNKFPDEEIKKLGNPVRKICADWMKQQSDRFRPTESDNGAANE